MRKNILKKRRKFDDLKGLKFEVCYVTLIILFVTLYQNILGILCFIWAKLGWKLMCAKFMFPYLQNLFDFDHLLNHPINDPIGFSNNLILISLNLVFNPLKHISLDLGTKALTNHK